MLSSWISEHNNIIGRAYCTHGATILERVSHENYVFGGFGKIVNQYHYYYV